MTDTDETDEEKVIQMRYGLAAQSAKLLLMLARNMYVSRETIEAYTKSKGGREVAIHRLRRQLDTVEGLKDAVHYRRGVGYWLDLETRKRVLNDAQPDQMGLPFCDEGEDGRETVS